MVSLFILLGTFIIVYLFDIFFTCLDQFGMPLSGRHPEGCGLSPQAQVFMTDETGFEQGVLGQTMGVSQNQGLSNSAGTGNGSQVQSSTTPMDSQVLNFERHPISIPPHRIISTQSIVSKMMDGNEISVISSFRFVEGKNL